MTENLRNYSLFLAVVAVTNKPLIIYLLFEYAVSPDNSVVTVITEDF